MANWVPFVSLSLISICLLVFIVMKNRHIAAHIILFWLFISGLAYVFEYVIFVLYNSYSYHPIFYPTNIMTAYWGRSVLKLSPSRSPLRILWCIDWKPPKSCSLSPDSFDWNMVPSYGLVWTPLVAIILYRLFPCRCGHNGQKLVDTITRTEKSLYSIHHALLCPFHRFPFLCMDPVVDTGTVHHSTELFFQPYKGSGGRNALYIWLTTYIYTLVIFSGTRIGPAQYSPSSFSSPSRRWWYSMVQWY